jgi:hypothetical protein
MPFARMICALCAGSLVVLSCKYSAPEAATGTPKEEPLSSEKHTSVEPVDQKDTPEEAKRAPVEASGSCDDRACSATDECCKGYQCGFDPERSKVQRYCLVQ